MLQPLVYRSIRTSREYDQLLDASYMKVKPRVEEIVMPGVQVIAVTGREPPASKPYQEAIAVLYGIGYSVKMGLRFGKLPKPERYFDYRVGALGTFWWSTGKTFEIANAQTVRWQAYLMVPAFVTRGLVEKATGIARAKHPDVPYDRASLQRIDEGRAVQMLHVGPYDREQPTIDRLHQYVADHGLSIAGKHHEIYISDPRRTSPEKLKTVIRIAVRASRMRARRSG
jgi:hypothetical protein